jgi:hypothetical protein
MVKRKMTKGQTAIYKALSKKLKVEEQNPTKHQGELVWSVMFLLHM